MTNTTNLVEKALIKAVELHKGQVRKGGGNIPYVVHPIVVGIIVTQYSNSPELIAGGILGGLLGAFFDLDYHLAALGGYVGTDILDNLVKTVIPTTITLKK